MADELRGKRVAVLVTDGFEQVQMTKPRSALENRGSVGATVELLAPVPAK